MTEDIQLKKLYIEPTSDCNLNCEMCFRHTWFDEKSCDMSYEMFERILHTLPESVDTIFFGGMGEPLHHPQTVEMIKTCSNEGLTTELLTNGTLIDEAMVNDLLEAGLNKLWLSIDDLEPPTAAGMGHQHYNEQMDALRTYNRIRRRINSQAELGITFVATKSNVHQLSGLPYFVNLYEISEVNVSNMYPSDQEAQEETLYERTLNMSIGSDEFGSTRPIINIPYMDFDLLQVQTGLKGLFEKMNFNLQVGGIAVPRRSQHCRFVSEGMAFVRSDGDVSPCMALLHNGLTVVGDTERKIYHHSFGNINEQGLEEIYMSEAYTVFRKRVIEFDFSPCMNCGHCSYTEDNLEDCFGNEKPTCGACLWAEGLLSCP